MKLAICNELFDNWEFENIISYCANLGFDGLEIAPYTLDTWPNKLSSRRRDTIRNFAENHKIEIVGLHHLLVGPPALSLSSPDQEIRKMTQRYILDLIDLCADLGGRRIIVDSPAQRNIVAHQSFQEVWSYAVDIFTNCLPQAEARNVTICIEPMSPLETNFINTAAQAMKLIEVLNHPNFRLHLDARALCFEKKSIPDIINESARYLTHFHANDRQGHEPGCGTLDFKPIIEALRMVDYHEYLSVEVFDFSDGAEVIANRAYNYLSKIL